GCGSGCELPEWRRAAAVDVHLRAATSVAHRLRSVDVEDAGKNTGQTDDVPAIERQVLHALVIDQSGDRGGSRIDQGRLRVDIYLGFNRTQLEGRIYAQVLTHGQLQSSLDLFLKAFELEG